MEWINVSDPKILLVEDEALVGIEIKNTLQSMGYTRTELIASGQEVVHKARNNPVDLILMDVNLRGEMDGVEATKKIHETTDVPLIFITAYSNDSIISRIKETNAIGYIVKPIDDPDLKSMTERILEGNENTDINRGGFFEFVWDGVQSFAEMSYPPPQISYHQ